MGVRGSCLALLVTAAAAAAAGPAPAVQEWAASAVAVVAESRCRVVGTAEISDAGSHRRAVGRYLTTVAEQALRGAAADRWQVIDGWRVAAALRQGESAPATDPGRLAEVLAALGMDGVLLGSVSRSAAGVQVTASLIRLPGGTVTPLPVLDLPWDGDLLALWGESHAMAEERGLRPKLADVVRLAASQPDEPPPVLNTAGPFSLEVLVAGQPLRPERRGREAAVRLPVGEAYTLRVTNRSRERVGVALFIDGLNTVGQRCELPSAGLKWIVEPGASVEIQGWQLGDAERRAFTVVGSGESVARRQGWTEQLGLITASFYASESAGAVVGGEERRDLPIGTGEGEAQRSQVTRVEFRAADTPAATLALRYEADAVRIGG